MRWSGLAASALLLAALVACGGAPAGERGVKDYAQPAVVQGLSIVGRVQFRPDGSLEIATLERDTRIGEAALPAGTILHLGAKGEPDWCFLPEDLVIQGHLCQGGGDDWMTCFYPSGRLKSCGLAAVELIDGIPCDKGTFWTETLGGGGRTHFFESGRLRSARVARDVQVQGRALRKGQHVKLDEAGTILELK